MIHAQKLMSFAGWRRALAVCAASFATLGLVCPPLLLAQTATPRGGAEIGFWELMERTEQVLETLPRETFELPAVVAQVGNEASALLRFVREKTFWVPYRGSLRGARGVLMDRLGNSYDRALFLAALLEEAGHEVRLAKTNLAEDVARKLLEVVDREHPLPAILSPRPGAPMGLAQVDPTAYKDLLLDSTAAAAVLSWQQKRERATEQVVPQALALLEHAGDLPARLAASVPADGAASPHRLEAMREHVWVQVRESADLPWTDLDPLPLDAPPAAPETTFAAAELPATDRHRVTVRVLTERWARGRLTQDTALERTFPVSELLGQHILFTNSPLGLAEPPSESPAIDSDDVAAVREEVERARVALLAVDEFLPMFRVGSGKTVFDQSVASSGTLNPHPNLTTASRKLNKAVGALRGLGAAKGEDGHWTAEWLEYRVERPGESPRVIRREVFDLVGPAARVAARRGDPATGDPATGELVAELLRDAASPEVRLERALGATGASRILFLPCDVSPEFVASTLLRQTLRNRKALGRMLVAAQAGSRADGSSAALELQMEPLELYQLVLERKLLSPHAQRTYIDEPVVLASHQRLVLADPKLVSSQEDADNAVRLRLAVDLVHAPVAVRERPAVDAFAVRLEQGVLDTYLETSVLAPAVDSTDDVNCSGLHKGFLDAGVEWVALLPGASQEGSSEVSGTLTGWPADAEARALEARAQGYLIVLPPHPATREESALWAFWQIDPVSGQCVGIGAHGWGVAGTETMANINSIAMRTIYVGGSYGLRLVCLYCKGLVAVEVLNTTLQALWFLQAATAYAYGTPPPTGPPLQIPTPGTGDKVTDDAIGTFIEMICSFCPGPKKLTGPKPKPKPPPKFGRPPRRKLPPSRGGPNPAPTPKPPRKKGPPKNSLPR